MWATGELLNTIAHIFRVHQKVLLHGLVVSGASGKSESEPLDSSEISLIRPQSRSVSAATRADEVIGIDLGTTNSCVAVMEGKVWLSIHAS